MDVEEAGPEPEAVFAPADMPLPVAVPVILVTVMVEATLSAVEFTGDVAIADSIAPAAVATPT